MYWTFNFRIFLKNRTVQLCIHSKCSHLNMHCHIRFSILLSTEGDAGPSMRNCECASILLSTEGDACPSGCSKSSECSAAVGGGVVGGFVGGVLMTAVVAAVIFVVFAQRMRSVHMRIFEAHYYWSCFS